MGCVERVAEPARGGGADRPADGEGGPAVDSGLEVDLGDLRGSQARGVILVFPVGPGLRPRKVPVGADADAGNQHNKDQDRPKTPHMAGGSTGRWRGLVDWLARWGYRRAGRRPPEMACLVLTIVGRQFTTPNSILGVQTCAGQHSTRSRAPWWRAYLYGFIAEVHPATPGGVARGLNARRRCVWSQPAWRRVWSHWPAQGPGPSRLSGALRWRRPRAAAL